VAVNSKGYVFVSSRSGTTGPAYPATAAQLLEFGPDGKFIREIEHNFYAWSFAHTVKIDKQDNLWVTDKGSDMVIMFNPQVTPWHGAVCSERKSRDGDDALDLGGTGCDLTSQKLVLVRWAEERLSHCGQLSFSREPTIDTRQSPGLFRVFQQRPNFGHVARITGIMQFE